MSDITSKAAETARIIRSERKKQDRVGMRIRGNMEDYYLTSISRLATENGRLRFLVGEAISQMSHAEVFIGSREKMHPEGRRQWDELINRMRTAIEPDEPLDNKSALLVGGE